MASKNTLNKFYYESPDGLRYYFDGRMVSHAGIGLQQIKFIEDFGPQQDGSTVRDWRINPRTIALEIFLQGDSCCQTRGEQLAELINIIRPNRGTSREVSGWLRFFNDASELMEIPVHVSRGPSGDFNYNAEIGKYQVADTVQFYAADPIWREFEKKNQVVDFGEGSCLGDCLGDDFCIISTTFTSFAITYGGTWDGDQIDIFLTGPMANIAITNSTTGKTIELNHVIAVGDSVLIQIRPEFVTVTDNNGNNLIGSITSISDLVDFVLVAEGQITSNGENLIIVTQTGVNSNSAIEIGYWERHISAYGLPQC